MYCGDCTGPHSEWNLNKMTNRNRKKRKGVKEKNPEVKSEPPEIVNNKSDGLIREHIEVKEKPPDIVPCELNCSKCLKVEKHMDAMLRYICTFSASVMAERDSIEQLEELLNSEKIHECNELLKTTINLNKKSFVLKNLTAELCEQTSKLDICSVQKIRVHFLLEDKDNYIELGNILRSRLDDVMKKTVRLKTLELDNVILNTTKKADQALEYLNMETTLPIPFVNNPVLKVMKKKVLVKREAEQVLEYLNMEVAGTLHSVDTKVVKVKEKDVVEASTTYGILQDFY